MTPKECALKIIEQQEVKDCEKAHILADGALCDLLIYLGYEEVVNEFRLIRKLYS